MPDAVDQVVARNMMPGPTVLSLDLNGRTSVEWMGKGDPQGRDVQYVPDEIVRSPRFRVCCERGILQVEEDPSALIDKQVQAWKKRMDDDQNTALEVVDHKPDRDLIGLACVGPGSREGSTVTCGAPVPMRASEVDLKPPLCDLHVHLAGRYVPEKTTEERTTDDGETKTVAVTRWRHA